MIDNGSSDQNNLLNNEFHKFGDFDFPFLFIQLLILANKENLKLITSFYFFNKNPPTFLHFLYIHHTN